jgi:hypothetical protein
VVPEGGAGEIDRQVNRRPQSITNLTGLDESLSDLAQRDGLIGLALFCNELIVKIFPDLAVAIEINLDGDSLAILVGNEWMPSIAAPCPMTTMIARVESPERGGASGCERRNSTDQSVASESGGRVI